MTEELRTFLKEKAGALAAASSACAEAKEAANRFLAALGTAMATYAGQNYGAGRIDRVRRSIWVAHGMTL